MLLPVILCGGAGTRLWPSSRRAFPKQFLNLFGDSSLLQKAVQRLGSENIDAPLLITSDEHRFLVAEQMRELNVSPKAIILEPEPKNTAPAIALAALAAQSAAGHADRQTVLAVFPADHLLEGGEALEQALAEGTKAAREGHLVTFGISPDGPETGYGYIQEGAALGSGSLKKVARFVEKPDRPTAERYLAEGGYHWNAGIFIFRADRYLDELGTYEPELLAACREAFEKAEADQDFLRVNPEAFGKAKSISIDYAVMERTSDAVVRPLDVTWSDVGSWDSVWRHSDKDARGNALRGDVLALDSSNNLILSERSLIAALGVEDLVVVESDDAFLVCHRDKVQDVREIVSALDKKGSQHHQVHKKVQRPWGSFESLDSGPGFQVKRLTVRPGRSLSLQRHRHRAEHWVVVSGTALVTRGEEVMTLEANQSTYIPLGVVHRLENPGKELLEIVEVQSGNYLGEDDIERFADVYGRS